MRLVYNSSRFTKDLDASFTKISTEKLKFLVEGSLSEDLDDGFKFKSGRWSVINETNEYQGVRYSFEFSFLERISQSLQVDFTHSELQTNFKLHPLENLKVSVKIYAKELIISEKLQTVVKRENLNTRAKDIYDINFLFESGFNPKELKDFIFLVFKVRETAIPDSFFIFAKSIDTNYLEQSWSYYLKHKKTKNSFSKEWEKFLDNMRALDLKIAC